MTAFGCAHRAAVSRRELIPLKAAKPRFRVMMSASTIDGAAIGGCLMRHLVSTAFAAALFIFGLPALSLASGAQRHFLFAWAGDPSGKGEDFIAVINGDPASPNYGQLVATGASEIGRAHV